MLLISVILQLILLKTDVQNSLQAGWTLKLSGCNYFDWKDYWRSGKTYIAIIATQLKKILSKSLYREADVLADLNKTGKQTNKKQKNQREKKQIVFQTNVQTYPNDFSAMTSSEFL